MSTPEKDAAMLKDLTRKAHEAVQELKGVIREARQVRKELTDACEVEIRTRLEPVVKLHIRELTAATDKAIEATSDAIDKRFDTIVDIMLGEDKHSQRRGRLSIVQMVENKKAMEEGRVPPHADTT